MFRPWARMFGQYDRKAVFLLVTNRGQLQAGARGIKAAVINKGSNLPCSFAAQVRCSLVADHCGYAPRLRLAGRQNPGGVLLPLFITAD
jgi:hypothetical protein